MNPIQQTMLTCIPGVSEESPFRLPPFKESTSLPFGENARSKGYLGHVVWNNPIISGLVENLIHWDEGGDLGLARHIIEKAYEYEENGDEIDNHIDLVSAFVLTFIFDHCDRWEDNPIVISHFDNCRELGLMIAKKTLKPDVDWDNPVIKNNKQHAYTLDEESMIHGFTCSKTDDRLLICLSTRVKDLTINGPYEGEFSTKEEIGFAESVSDVKKYIHEKMNELFIEA